MRSLHHVFLHLPPSCSTDLEGQFIYGAQQLLQFGNMANGAFSKSVERDIIAQTLYVAVQLANFFLFRRVKIGIVLGIAILAQGKQPLL